MRLKSRGGAAEEWRETCMHIVTTVLVQCPLEAPVTTPATKTLTRNFRVSPTDDELFRRAAALVGESLSEFLVESGRERAEMLLADRTQFVMDRAAWKAFNAALDRPPEANPAVVELLRRPPPA
jgi:uncharacterized protein (DUF1778 family)